VRLLPALREVGSQEVQLVMSRGRPMTEPSTHVVLESREQLFSALGEAAELEHNLLCLYLYAAFSLKRTKEEGITAPQLEAVWRSYHIQVVPAAADIGHTEAAYLVDARGDQRALFLWPFHAVDVAATLSRLP